MPLALHLAGGRTTRPSSLHLPHGLSSAPRTLPQAARRAAAQGCPRPRARAQRRERPLKRL